MALISSVRLGPPPFSGVVGLIPTKDTAAFDVDLDPDREQVGGVGRAREGELVYVKVVRICEKAWQKSV